MPRDEQQPGLPACLNHPQVSLVGRVDEKMIERFHEQLGQAHKESGDVAVEMTTLGGDADLARRLALDVATARERLSGRLLFLGKAAVYSAGTTVMAAFPRDDRYLTRDSVLLIHCRQLEQQVNLSGPIRSSLPQLNAIKAQIEVGITLEEAAFRELVEGSDISLDQLFEKALCDWYVTAEEALKLRLVADLV
jgi:ATP-dependent Clp protease, protease subunit